MSTYRVWSNDSPKDKPDPGLDCFFLVAENVPLDEALNVAKTTLEKGFCVEITPGDYEDIK